MVAEGGPYKSMHPRSGGDHRLTAVTDPRGAQTRYSYDGAGRVSQIIGPAMPVVSGPTTAPRVQPPVTSWSYTDCPASPAGGTTTVAGNVSMSYGGLNFGESAGATDIVTGNVVLNGNTLSSTGAGDGKVQGVVQPGTPVNPVLTAQYFTATNVAGEA